MTDNTAKIYAKSEKVRHFIIDNTIKHPSDIAKVTSEKFGLSRQAVNKHLQKLVDENFLVSEGQTRQRKYKLCPLVNFARRYELQSGLAEDAVWREDIAPQLKDLPGNVFEIWNYSFTEMLNNAIDHSKGNTIQVHLERNAANVQIRIADDGVGIFKKIQEALGLADERHAVLELAKGKFTTDPQHHSGEGIFFTSRMFDSFVILSGGVFFTHQFGKDEDWILEREKFVSGTSVWMRLSNHTARSTKKIFDQFASDEDYGFVKTVVPVRFAQYGNEQLVSRSQAKRLMMRVDRFKIVILDFEQVQLIGQAFADEIFRVFHSSHPQIELIPIHMNSAIKRMIMRARSGLPEAPEPS